MKELGKVVVKMDSLRGLFDETIATAFVAPMLKTLREKVRPSFDEKEPPTDQQYVMTVTVAKAEA